MGRQEKIGLLKKELTARKQFKAGEIMSLRVEEITTAF